MHDIAVNGGTVVLPGHTGEYNLGIKGDKIVEISSQPLSGRRVIDATDCLVLPGIVDSHTHFRDPAYTEKEDFITGTSAAAAGGVTTVLEMPLSDIATATTERFEKRRAHLEERAVIDFGLIAGVGFSTMKELEGLRDAGAVGAKTFMRSPYPGREKNFGEICVTDDAELFAIAREMARLDLTWPVHAENHKFTEELEEPGAYSSDRRPVDITQSYLNARPELVELEPVSKLGYMTAHLGTKTHVVHVTAGGAVDLIAEFQRQNVSITAEATLPHLLYNEVDAVTTLGDYGRLSPRVRAEEDRRRIWKGISEGTITTVSSDHASISEKDYRAGWEGTGRPTAWGMAGTEHLLLSVLDGARKLDLPLANVIKSLTEAPARLFGLWPRKGSLMPGFDADIAIVSTQKETVITGEAMKSKARWTLLEGARIPFSIEYTINRGRVVYEEGEVTAKPGDGEFIKKLS